MGITVMKPFGGGLFLDAGLSPFKTALPEAQCIQYTLDKPGMLTALSGIRGHTDLERLLAYLGTSPELATDHYRKLELHADDCIHCSHCDRRCPFHVQQGVRMDEIAEFFTAL